MTLKSIPAGYKIAIATFALVLIDQVVKMLVHFNLEPPTIYGHDSIRVFPWFDLCYVENPGFAFGMQLGGDGAVWGKLFLSLFRLVMIGALIYGIRYLLKKGSEVPKGVIVGAVFILAGAIGNLIDSMFYGMIFTASTPLTVATLGEGYSTFLMGKVVDMFYFPLFQWNNVPDWLSFLVDYNNYFFGAIFNLADAYISVAVVYLLIFYWKFFQEE
jgi:signal peptidase II